MHTAPPRPSLGHQIREPNRWLARRSASARALRDYAALPALTVAQDIAADSAAACTAASALAYSAEQADIEAIRLLEEAARDGFNQADLSAVAAAVRHIRRSAAADHQLAEATTLPPAA
jgi:hypothetical protein